ncbi:MULTISPECIES: copper resistance CopC family protein [Pseudoalteromonas]|uniref:copper resistance CopC family protein n=1 Tax=Pseudoalteromonas TaxID=53246 RepID=UPI0008250C47|nr:MULTISPECIES: copper resistance CopC family protein [Pseudoalteromonas]QLJ10139.1 copper resistance protein CopC [Pseudoalteromonas sp. JSTW]
MKFFKYVALMFVLTMPFMASAHVSVTHTLPQDKAMLMSSPEQLSLAFSGKVRLAKIVVQDAHKQPIDFDFKPTAAPSSDFSWPLPHLKQGNYTVKWIALGGDGHKMTGEFTFMIHATKHSNKTKMPENGHGNHNH